MHELRVAQFELPERFGAYRARAGQRPMREQVLDILDELGVPNSPRVISEYALACLGIELPIAKFASLRRDEERGFRKDPLSKPAWVRARFEHGGLCTDSAVGCRFSLAGRAAPDGSAVAPRQPSCHAACAVETRCRRS